MNKKLEFLKEYKNLCLKHGFELRGCGDCGSAWLSELSDENKEISKLSWNDDFQVIQFAGEYEINDKDRVKDGFKYE